jgi:predicted pyridoxine 5'-phosphate oxidase superfamily flavin-nucleotide-binding protein
MVDHVIPAPFHPGELRAQRLAGVPPRAAGTVPIRDRLTEQHRAFFPLLPFVCLAVPDADGWPLATLVQGAPGFVTAPDDARLVVASLPDADDPVRARIGAGAPAGLLGIDLGTRRRNRVNGVIEGVADSGFVVGVREAFGNCPRYIAVRQLRPAGRRREPAFGFGPVLPDRATGMLVRAVTLFVGSRSPAGSLDISHRGGPPGFVRVEGNTLVVPDYAGNRYYNTLGNLLAEPRAAIVLFDPASGDVLQLQGRVAIDWTAADARQDPPAERTWRFEVVLGVLRPGAFALGEAAAPVSGPASTTASAAPPARPA